MKIHNWENVIKFFVENKRETDLWDYVSALRGPDSGSNYWKEMITCIIRGECKVAFGIDYIMSLLENYNNLELIAFLNESIETSHHWFNHSSYALESLSKYYNEVMNNIKMSNLLLQLAYNLEKRGTDDISNIPITVREIVEKLYKEE